MSSADESRLRRMAKQQGLHLLNSRRRVQCATHSQKFIMVNKSKWCVVCERLTFNEVGCCLKGE